MWWFFGRSSGTKSGEVITALCPHCNEETPCQEIIESSQTTVWFVPVLGSERIKGYVCRKCGNQYDELVSKPITRRKEFQKEFTPEKGKEIQAMRVSCPLCGGEFDYEVDITTKGITKSANFKIDCPHCNKTLDIQAQRTGAKES